MVCEVLGEFSRGVVGWAFGTLIENAVELESWNESFWIRIGVSHRELRWS